MAGVLDTVYVVAAAAVAVAGIGYVAQRVGTRDGSQPWFEWTTLGLAALFLLALTAQYV